MKTVLKALLAGSAAVLAATLATRTLAVTPWQYEQARRANMQRFREDQRIDHLLRGGRITAWQARKMHREARHGALESRRHQE